MAEPERLGPAANFILIESDVVVSLQDAWIPTAFFFLHQTYIHQNVPEQKIQSTNLMVYLLCAVTHTY